MPNGAWIILLIAVLFILISAISFYCHFFGDSGGRSFELQANDSKPRIIMYKKKCSCQNSFKGLCKYCEVTDDFVGADGGVRIINSFDDYGGDAGFDSGPGQSPVGDPIRGFLGGGPSQNQGQSQSQSQPQYEYHPIPESSGMSGGGGGGMGMMGSYE